MSQADLQLRFDGPELAAHAMDVCVLAPSLMAFGELCMEANRVLNGDSAKVKVLLKADVKANCVTVEFQIVQTMWQQVGNLITNQNVSTAKEILEWIGIIGSSGTFTAGMIVGLIKFLRWKKDRKESSAEIRQTVNGNIVVVKIEGDNNTVTLPEQTYKLSQNVKVVESLKLVARPVSEEPGIEKATFVHNKKEELQIDKDCANELKMAHADTEEGEPQTFTAHIVTYGPIFDLKSKHWKFKMNNRVENLDISETTIAQEALARGGVSVGDTYKAKIEMIERRTKQGDFKTEFKIKEVLDFRPGVRRQQTDFLDNSQGSDETKS